MSIEPTAGILDIRNAIVRVSKLEFSGSTGFDTILNNVARNTVLLVDRNVEYTSSNSWALKLPNAWVAEFDAYWASGASGNIDFNVYNNVTSGTNGYTISMDDTTITVAYDGGSALATATLGSTLKNDTWRKIHVLFERDMISVALDGVPVLYFKDTLLRPRVYDENSGYIVASGLSADRKFKNIRVVNGDKWITDGTSNIAYVHGNVGIGTKTPEYTLDVKGDVRATGNLLIEGLTTTVGTQNLSIEDAIVEIGRGNDGGTSGKDVGFLFTRNNGSDTTNSNVALIYDESTDRLTFGYSDGGPTDSTLAINTSKSLDVVIPSGNVGVGTASPGARLDVVGDIKRSGATYTKTYTYSSITANDDLYIGRFSIYAPPAKIDIFDSGTALGSGSRFSLARHYDKIPRVQGFENSFFTTYKFYYQAVNTSVYDVWFRPNRDGTYIIQVDAVGFTDTTEPTSPTLTECDYGLFTADGNVGIGTVSPSNDLEITNQGGTFNLGGSLRNVYQSIGVSAASITAGYNTGSGPTNNGDGSYTWTKGGSDTNGAIALGFTATPYEQLKITFTAKTTDTTSPSFQLENPAFTTIYSNTLNSTYTTYTFYVTIPSNAMDSISYFRVYADDITWNAFTVERANVLSGGNIGIGVASPAYKLDVYNGTSGNDALINPAIDNDIILFDDQSSATTFNGTVYGNATRDTSSGYIQLTPNSLGQTGWVTWPCQLPNSWTCEFDMYRGSSTSGADAIHFIFYHDSASGDPIGATDNFRITFDEYNGNDVYLVSTIAGATTTLASTSLTYLSATYQKVVVNYDRGSISVSIDGVKHIDYKIAETAQLYSGKYVSFRGNTGGVSTEHRVRNIRITKGNKWVYSGINSSGNICYLNGRVGIGTASPTQKFHVRTSGYFLIDQPTTSYYTTMNGGSIAIGNPTTSGGYEFFIMDNSTTGSHITTYFSFRRGNSQIGSILTTGSTINFNTGSDYRLKENIAPMSNVGLEIINKLQPKVFNFKNYPGETVHGFIAHELQEHVPLAVSGEKDEMRGKGNVVKIDDESDVVQEDVSEPDQLEEGTKWIKLREEPVYQGVDMSKIVPYLVKAVQELYEENQSLKTRLDALENA